MKPESLSSLLWCIWWSLTHHDTLDSHTYQHLGDCCQAAFVLTEQAWPIWLQSLDPLWKEGTVLASTLASQVFPFGAFLPFRDCAILPLTSVPFLQALTFSYSLDFPPVTEPCSHFRSETLYSTLLHPHVPLQKFNSSLKFSRPNNLLTQDLLQELGLPCFLLCCWAYLGHTGQRDLSYIGLEFLIWMVCITSGEREDDEDLLIYEAKM